MFPAENRNFPNECLVEVLTSWADSMLIILCPTTWIWNIWTSDKFETIFLGNEEVGFPALSIIDLPRTSLCHASTLKNQKWLAENFFYFRSVVENP